MDFKDYWDEVHKQYSSDKIIYDNYLDDYKDILNSCKTKVLDLGCGVGNNSLYLLKHGFKVVGVDYSDVALKIVSDKLKDVETILTDISNPLPFEDKSFDLVIADLSLHYFNKETTKQIMKEIKRILTDNGYLIARVNSIDDILEWIGEDDIVIKLTGEEKADVVEELYSGVLNGVKGTAYTLIRINSNEKYNSLFAQLPNNIS